MTDPTTRALIHLESSPDGLTTYPVAMLPNTPEWNLVGREVIVTMLPATTCGLSVAFLPPCLRRPGHKGLHSWTPRRARQLDGLDGAGPDAPPPPGRLACQDGGTCHHDCGTRDQCWRVDHAEPLSGVYPGDEWPT
jgi:hypothetical protein